MLFFTAKLDMENQIIYWNGEDGLRWKAQMGIVDQKPCIVELGYEKNHQWFLVGNMLTPQFKVVTGKRTTHNPQREKPVGADEKPDYQWDTYSDDPFSKKDVKEAVQEWEIYDCIEDMSCRSRCVCGKENIRYLFTIRNLFNNSLIFPIGSSCIN